MVDGFTLYTATLLGDGAEAESLPGSFPTEPPLVIGSVINGRYAVERVLGHGGMGWVYDVEDGVHPERAVALKVVPVLARSEELSRLFDAEFRTMARLEHPNLARVYDFEQIHGSEDCAITMERIDGVAIDRALEDSRDWPTLLDYVVQVCRALSYVHSRGIVHHDLKPSNILVQADEQVRVIDFGIARDTAPPESGLKGTPLYMAPEVLMGSDRTDYRADLYSLGVTIYELLTGERPCPHKRLYEIAAWALTNEVVLPADCRVPGWLRDIVRRLCAPDPELRPRSANAVIEAINTAGGRRYELETSATRQSYVLTPRFAGRRIEHASAMEFIARRLRREVDSAWAGALVSESMPHATRVERALDSAPAEPAFLVGGESGIGKSRLMREVRQHAQLRRIVFLESNCYEGSPVEYGPIADLLLQLVPVVEQVDTADIVHRALPELSRIAPDLRRGRMIAERPRAATAEDERARLLEAVSTFLVGAARVVPFVIYVNDLQWSARGPARILAHLAERIRDDERLGRPVPLALLGSYRTDETQGRPAGEMLRRMRDEGTAIEVALAPLSAADVGEIIVSMLGIDHVPGPFLDRVAGETGGNPFFVQELMRMLLEDGSVYLEAGRWATVGSIGGLAIPATIADAFRRRFDLLSPVQQDVLRALAVQARPMPLDLLGAMRGNVHAMPGIARQLSERGLIVRAEGSAAAYTIAHDRMRETIYGDLEERERRAWHRRIGELIETRFRTDAGGEPPLDELAYHFWHAEAPEKALEYAIPAGKRAIGQNANQAALEHFEHALALLDAGDERYPLAFEHRADMLVRLSDYETALAAYHELLRKLDQGPLVQARINRKLADIYMQCSRLEQAVDYGWKALSAYGEKRPSGRLGWILATLGLFADFVLERLGLHSPKRNPANLANRVAAYDKLFRAYFFLEPNRTFFCTLRLWRIAGVSADSEAMACAKSGVAMMIGIAGMRRWANELFEEARKDADSAGSRWWSGTVEMRRAAVNRMAGLWNLEALDHAVEALRDAGDMFDLGAAVYHAADVCFHFGDINEAFERARAMNAATARIEPGAPASLRGNWVVEAFCRSWRGELNERAFEQYSTVSAAMKDVVGWASGLCEWGDALIREGRFDEGVEKLEEAWEVRRRHRLLDSYSAIVLYKLPHAYLQLPALDRLRKRRLMRIHAVAMRRTRRMYRGFRSPTLVTHAILLERSGKRAKTDACFREAIDIARSQNAGLFVSIGLYEWGRVQLARGEVQAAKDLLQESLRIAEGGGNVWLAERCRVVFDDCRKTGQPLV